MKIAYLVQFRGGGETGILRKVESQVAEWTRVGVDVGLFVATDASGVDAWTGLPQAVRVAAMTTGARSLAMTREHMATAIIDWSPDVVYSRQALAYPGLLRVIRRIPTVFEINTDDIAEYRLVSRRRYEFSRLTRGWLLGRSAGLVCVTRELCENPRFAAYGRPSVVVANGFTISSIPELPAPANPTPRLFFVGHPHAPWHGLDLLEEVAAAFPAWQFDVVGPGPDEFRQSLPNVTAHGQMEPAEYRHLLASADVAIGTLALFRKGMNEASPLKVREYLAAGVPVIIGYEDTDFASGAPFLLRLPNQPDGVSQSLDNIDQFVRSWIGRRVPRASIGHLDVAEKERSRLAFLQQRSLREGNAA